MGMMLRRHLYAEIDTTVNEQAEAVEQTAVEPTEQAEAAEQTAKKSRATRKAK